MMQTGSPFISINTNNDDLFSEKKKKSLFFFQQKFASKRKLLRNKLNKEKLVRSKYESLILNLQSIFSKRFMKNKWMYTLWFYFKFISLPFSSASSSFFFSIRTEFVNKLKERKKRIDDFISYNFDSVAHFRTKWIMTYENDWNCFLLDF